MEYIREIHHDILLYIGIKVVQRKTFVDNEDRKTPIAL